MKGASLSKAQSIQQLSTFALFERKDRICSLVEEDETSGTNYSKASTSISLKSDCEDKTPETWAMDYEKQGRGDVDFQF